MTSTKPRSRKTYRNPAGEAITPLSRKQRRSLARSCARVNLLEGSIRSGKTFTWLIRWFAFIADAPKRGALVMVGKSRDSLYRNFFEPIDNDPTLAVFKSVVSYRQGAPTARILGRTVHVMGANDKRSESKLRGMTVAGAYVDEVTVLDRDFFKQLLGRMSVDGAQMFATTNPDAKNHWLKTQYMDRRGELPDWYIEKFVMDDNPGLSEAYKASLRREYTGLWYRRFILGEWVAAEGAVYPEFDSDVHAIDESMIPTIERVLIAALDYGDVHHTRAYLLGMGRATFDNTTGQLVADGAYNSHKAYALFVLDEFAPGKSTMGRQAADFKKWVEGSKWGRPEFVAVDPAAAAFRRELFELGMVGQRAHNSVLSGIQTISSLLSAHRMFVNRSCEHLVNAFGGYRWDEKASLTGTTKPIKEDDDEVDALRYAVYTSRRFWRAHIPLSLDSGDDLEQEAA